MLMQPVSFKRHRFPADVIRHAVWLYFRFTLSFRDVEELLAQRGIEASYEAIRCWTLKFGQAFAQNLRRSRPKSTGRWHLDEMVVKVAGKRMWLWRAVDDEGEVLDMLVQKRRNTGCLVTSTPTLLRCDCNPFPLSGRKSRASRQAPACGVGPSNVHGAVVAALPRTPFAPNFGACWRSTADVKRLYATASVVSSERIVFNIKGNDHRLVTAIDAPRRIVRESVRIISDPQRETREIAKFCRTGLSISVK